MSIWRKDFTALKLLRRKGIGLYFNSETIVFLVATFVRVVEEVLKDQAWPRYGSIRDIVHELWETL
jgi:hypothetical protein